MSIQYVMECPKGHIIESGITNITFKDGVISIKYYCEVCRCKYMMSVDTKSNMANINFDGFLRG